MIDNRFGLTSSLTLRKTTDNGQQTTDNGRGGSRLTFTNRSRSVNP